MTTIVTRAGKGSPLTHTEVDTNFTNLNTAKLETAAIPLGTLQAPSVSFLNDSDTGIFCPQGGNSLAIATGGQYAITCTSTQAVGIKTANPQGALHVAGSTRVGADSAADAILEIGEGATGNRNSYIDIVADTTYTDYGLRVIRNNTGANATSELKHRGTGALNFTTQEAAPIVFNTTNSPRLTILAGGNVGIGTSAPAQKLEIQDGSISIGSSSNVNATNVLVAGYGYILSSTKYGNTSIRSTYSNSNNSASLEFYVASGSTSTAEAMRIDSAGRVGIGTTTPTSYTAGAVPVHVHGGANPSEFRLTTDASGQASATDGAVLQLSGTALALWNAENDVIKFGTNNGEAARIDSSKRLLIGTGTSRSNFHNNANYTTQFQLEGTNFQNSALSLIANSTTSGDSTSITLAKSAGAGLTSNTLVANNELLGDIRFEGSNGTNFVEAARIRCEIDGGTPGAASMPGRLVFSTTADGGSSPTERLRITSTGQVRLAGAGITFNGDTAAANELDDYEEGTWTPVSASQSGSSPTYTSVGRYTKIGRQVIAYAKITYTSTNGSGGIYIDPLPFGAVDSASLCMFGNELTTGRTLAWASGNTTTVLVIDYTGAHYQASGYIYALTFIYTVA